MIHAVAALAAALLVAPASAQDGGPTRSQAVAHADLNLRDANDLARLDRRIAHAARDLCGDASAFDLMGRRKARQCTDTAVMRVAAARARAIGTAGTTLVAGR